MKKLYQMVGMMMRNAQAVERNLSIIVYFDEILSVFANNKKVSNELYSKNHSDADELLEEMSGMTMGEIIKIAKNTPSMNRDLVEDLRRVLNYRNYVAHQMFKSQAFFVGSKISRKDLAAIKTQIAEELDFSSELNDRLLDNSNGLRKKYNVISRK